MPLHIITGLLYSVTYSSIVFRTCSTRWQVARALRGVDSLHYQCTKNEVVTRAGHSAGDDSVDSKLEAVKVHKLTSLDDR